MRSTVVTEQDVQRDIRLILKDDARPRSLLVAYALWLLLFWAGAHRFYLGRPRSAVMMLACSVVTLGVGGLIWACVDAFLIPGMLARRNVRFIEPRWMRVQPLGDAVEPRQEPSSMPPGRSLMPCATRDVDDVPTALVRLDRTPDVGFPDEAEPRFVYHADLPFLRRPAERGAPRVAA